MVPIGRNYSDLFYWNMFFLGYLNQWDKARNMAWIMQTCLCPPLWGCIGQGTEQESTPSSKWEDIQVGGGNWGNDSLMSTALCNFFKYMIQRISSLGIPDQWDISALWIYRYPRGENNGRQDGNEKRPFKVSRPKCKQLRGYGGRGGSVPSLQERRLWLDRVWGNQMEETKPGMLSL